MQKMSNSKQTNQIKIKQLFFSKIFINLKLIFMIGSFFVYLLQQLSLKNSLKSLDFDSRIFICFFTCNMLYI